MSLGRIESGNFSRLQQYAMELGIIGQPRKVTLLEFGPTPSRFYTTLNYSDVTGIQSHVDYQEGFYPYVQIYAPHDQEEQLVAIGWTGIEGRMENDRGIARIKPSGHKQTGLMLAKLALDRGYGSHSIPLFKGDPYHRSTAVIGKNEKRLFSNLTIHPPLRVLSADDCTKLIAAGLPIRDELMGSGALSSSERLLVTSGR